MRRLVCTVTFIAALWSTATADDETPKAADEFTLKPSAEKLVDPVKDLGLKKVTVQVSLYRLLGSLGPDSETSLTDEGIIPGYKGLPFGTPYTMFTHAQLTLSPPRKFTDEKLPDMKFTADEKGWKWNGRDEPEHNSSVLRIAEPKVRVQAGVEFTLAIASADPVSYFLRRSDGLFELRQVQQDLGMSMTARGDYGTGGRFVFDHCEISTGYVERRQRIDGVPFDVGEPVVKTLDANLTIAAGPKSIAGPYRLALKPGVSYGIFLAYEQTGMLLLKLVVDPKN